MKNKKIGYIFTKSGMEEIDLTKIPETHNSREGTYSKFASYPMYNEPTENSEVIGIYFKRIEVIKND